MARAVRWSVVAGMLAAGVLAGCDSSPDDPVTPTPSPSVSSSSPSPSASPSPSVTESGPQIPAAAREKTDAGAEAFVKYFFDQFNVAWTKPEPGLIKSLSDPECQFCAKGEAAALDLATHDEKYAGQPVTIEKAEVFGGAPENQQFVQVRHVQNAVDIVDAKGAVVASDPKQKSTFFVTLRWSGGSWRLLEMERTA